MFKAIATIVTCFINHISKEVEILAINAWQRHIDIVWIYLEPYYKCSYLLAVIKYDWFDIAL